MRLRRLREMGPEAAGQAKAKAFLVTDGQVTVTSSASQVRMAASDRFFVFALNLTSASSPFVTGIDTILVPRAVFLDSKLKADFDAGNFNPLPNARMYGDDLSKASISDGVAAVIAGTLTGAQASDVLNRLLLNASGGSAHSYVDITNTALVANLPSDVIKILPWQAVVNGPTGAMPQDFWQKIGAIASTVVNALVYVGQMIYKGLVALGTFLVNLAQAIADWGMKALGAVWNAAVAVAQKVGEALSKAMEWLVSWIEQQAHALMDAILKPIADALGGWIAGIDDVFGRILSVGDTDSVDIGMIYGSVFSPGIVSLVQGISIAVQLAIGVIIAASVIVPGAFAFSAIIKKVISHAVASATEHWLGLSISSAAGVIVGVIVPSSDAVWTLYSGIGTLMAGLLIMLVQEIYAKWTLGRFMPFLTGDYIGLALALLGFFLSLGASMAEAAIPATYHLLSVLGAVIAGIGLIVTLGTDSWNDSLGTVGFLDEAVAAGSFGFATVQAFR